jgi:L-asparaginase II
MAFVVARQFRGDNIEAIHYGSIVVVDASGNITHSLSDPDQPFQTRSSIKPFQVLPLFTSGAADKYAFTPEQIAIMCGSHNGSDEHRQVVVRNLEAAGNNPDLLQCGTHWPLQMQLEQDYPTSGEDQDQLRHNCSGKHSGFLALARHIGQDPATYLDPDSELQTRVRDALVAMTDYPAERLKPSIDGCSAPNYALPLYNLALGFMRLATLQGPDQATTRALQRVREAVWTHPEMISGKHRIDLDVMRSFPNNVVCKVGAEGLEGIGFADPPIGIAIKIHDGAGRARPPVIVETLKQIGVIDNIARFPFLLRRERPEVRNNRDLLSGHIAADFKLREA